MTALVAVDYGVPGQDYNAADAVATSNNGTHLVSPAGPAGVGPHQLSWHGTGTAVAKPQLAGLFTYQSGNSLARVPDGTSTTILFGEYAGAYISWNGGGGIPSGAIGASWSCGFNYSGFGTPTAYDPTNPATEQYNQYAFFSSRHAGNVVNFAFADGSRAQPLDIDRLEHLGLLDRLSGRGGRHPGLRSVRQRSLDHDPPSFHVGRDAGGTGRGRLRRMLQRQPEDSGQFRRRTR